MSSTAAESDTGRARAVWIAGAAQAKFGTCGDCGHDRDTDGKHLYVARADRSRTFRCFDCATTKPKRRRPAVTTTITRTKKTPATSAPAEGALMMLPLTELKPAADNPRKKVGDVTEMAQSMSELGVLEPFVAVRQNGHYLIVAGARRHAAATLAKLETVPVLVREMTEEQRVKAMLIENLQRENLTPLEEAEAFQRLVEEFSIPQRELATKVGRSQGHISKRMALLGLPEMVMSALDSGGITLAEAAEIAKLGGDTKHIQYVLDRQSYQSVEGAVETALDRMKKEQDIEEAAVAAEAEGLRVVRMIVDGYYTKLPKGAYRLEKNAQYGSDVLNLDPIKHASLDCHAVAVGGRDSRGRIPVCTDRRKHPTAKTPDQRNREASAKTNQSWAEQSKTQESRRDLATPVVEARRAFVLDLLDKKAAFDKTEALELILRQAIANAVGPHGDVHRQFFARFVDTGPGDLNDALGRFAAKGIAELTRVALAATLLDLDEDHCGVWAAARGTWDEGDAAYLAFLERYGYEISDVERQFLPAPTKARKVAA